jgi:hypothetical protein
MWMQLRGKQIPAWVLLLVILGGAAAAIAVGSSCATVLTGDVQVAVAGKLYFKGVLVETYETDPPASVSCVVHLANDRQSYRADFATDAGDKIVIIIGINNLAGIDTAMKIITEAPPNIEVSYSTSWLSPGVQGNIIRLLDGEWVVFVPANDKVVVYQWMWIKPSTTSGQYEVQTWIEQKFQ